MINITIPTRSTTLPHKRGIINDTNNSKTYDVIYKHLLWRDAYEQIEAKTQEEAERIAKMLYPQEVPGGDIVFERWYLASVRPIESCKPSKYTWPHNSLLVVVPVIICLIGCLLCWARHAIQ